MNTTTAHTAPEATMLTVADFKATRTDDRQLGFGWTGSAASWIASATECGSTVDARELEVDAAEQRILDAANEAGWDYEQLAEWTNSKDGRFAADVILGGSGRFDARVDEAIRFGLLPR